MDSNGTKQVPAFIGIGCSILTLIASFCPACMFIAVILDLTDKTKNWEAMPTVRGYTETAALCFGGLFCLGILFAIIIGRLSIRYLLRRDK